METNKQHLSIYAAPISTTAKALDIEDPLSFKDWVNTRVGIIPGQEYTLYNQYLTDWYTAKKDTFINEKTNDLKVRYLSLLKQLQVFFTQEEKEKWYNFINFSSEREVLLAIPFFAKKLKEISLYYIELRKKLKRSKLQYNIGGTGTGFILDSKEHILSNFSKSEYNTLHIPSYIFANIPDLSATKDTLVAQVEEIYDDHSYFDHSSTMPVSAYFDLNDSTTKKFFKTKDLNLPELEWLFTNNITLTGDLFNPDTGLDIATEYLTKYTGQDHYISDLINQTQNVENYSIDINTGNNFFLWPVGVYRSEVISDTRYVPQPLTATDIETLGTAGLNIEGADTIFVKTANGVEGAWLQLKQYNTVDVDMISYIDSSKKTSFIFPYPGYGLSSENMEWTGPSMTFTSEFFYLDNSFKKSVEYAYWNFNHTLTTVIPVAINNTSLIDCKAFASTNYTNADKIRTWQVPPYTFESSYKGESNQAWLYRFTRTDLPIAPGENVIYWPYERVNKEETFPDYYPKDVFICNQKSLTSIDFPFSTASDSITSADVVYKITNYKHTKEQATECAWLSGVNIKQSGFIFTRQTSLNLIGEAGTLTRFIWDGTTQTDINTVFKTYAHQDDCPYVTDKTLTYTDFSKCTCGAVHFSPFGHAGATVTDNNSYADIIFEDTEILKLEDVFVLLDWRDTANNNYKNSLAFAWYKTNSKTGFGDGKWISEIPSGIPRLVKGKPYCFYRPNLKVIDNSTSNLPSLTLRHKYSDVREKAWVKAKKVDNTWYSTGIASDMVLNQEDLLIYEKASTTSFQITGNNLQQLTITENKGSLWSNYDYLTIVDPNSPITNITQTVYVTYPNNSFVNPAVAAITVPGGVPLLNRDRILSVKRWSLTGPDGTIETFDNVAGFSFTPVITGVYNVSVVAVTGTQTTYTLDATGGAIYTPGTTGLYTFNNIPSITAVPLLQEVTSLTAIDTPVPGFVLNTDLFGWDYNSFTQKFTTTPGARPFWAKAYTDKSNKTDFKGTESWGIPIKVYDTYNFITQPDISTILLETGQYVEYERKYNNLLVWKQPLERKIEVNEKQWCTLNFTVTSTTKLQGVIDNLRDNIDLVVIPLSSPSPITLTNIVNNEPVEIYYNAINTFTWNITAVPQVLKTITTENTANISYNATRPWAHFANRFTPTVARMPTLESIYAQKDTGGYFLPNNLGTSLYNSKDYTFNLGTTSSALTSDFEDVNVHFAGRSVSKHDHITPYKDLQENATWLKDSFITGELAGNVNREVIKKYQKFIPYQPSSESVKNKQYGLVTTNSKLTPWGGTRDEKWIDSLNAPRSFTGVFNIDNWVDSQQLKNTKKRIYNWSTDIFGNQYALFKDIAGVDFYSQKNVLGELWVRKNSQIVQPAYIALDSVFDTYKGLSVYADLTGNGIKKIDVFFDTLYIETTNTVIFEKIIYSYEDDNIYSFVDSSHTLSLPCPVTTNLSREFARINLASTPLAVVGDTWFFPEQKIVLVSVCELSGSNVLPTIYELDISKETLERVFPV